MATPTTMTTRRVIGSSGKLICRRALQRPDNRDRYYALVIPNTASQGLYLQIREPIQGWQTETNPITATTNSVHGANFAFDGFSNMCIVYTDASDFVNTYWISADGGTTVETVHTAVAAPATGGLGVTGLKTGGFTIAWIEGASGSTEFKTDTFSNSAHTWGGKTDLGQPGSDLDDAVSAWVGESPVDGTLHYVASGQDSGASEGYMVHRKGSGSWADVFQIVAGADYIFSHFDAALSYKHGDIVYIVLGYNVIGVEATAQVDLFIRTEAGVWPTVSPSHTQISDGIVNGAQLPTVAIDTNDDLYIAFKEYDSSVPMNAIFLRQYSQTSGLGAIVKVADADNNAVNGHTNGDNGNPRYPAIIQPPVGRKIGDLPILWGDRLSTSHLADNLRYISERVVKANPRKDESFDFKDMDLPRLNSVFVYDEPAGGSWARWRASTSTVGSELSCASWLSLHPSLDSGQLLFGSADPSGPTAYVNELLTGTTDNSANIGLTYPTAILDMGSPGTVKEFTYIDMRVSSMGGASSFTISWDTDDSIKTDSFTITTAGSHLKSLNGAKGRIIQVTLTETSAVAPPVFQDFEIIYKVLPKLPSGRAQ